MKQRSPGQFLATLAAAALLPACAWWPNSKPTNDPAPTPASSPVPGLAPTPSPIPSPSPAPSTTVASLRFVPVAIRAQADRPLSADADAAPVGFTFEGRVETTDAALPFAIDPDLHVNEARDDRGRNLATGRSVGEFSAATTPGVAPWPRWIPAKAGLPSGSQPTALVEWKCFGLTSLPKSIDRLRGFAVAWIVAESATRDVGIVSARGPVELVPSLRLTIGPLTRAENSATLEATLERLPAIAPYSGLNTDIPRIVAATVLDQRGQRIADVPLHSSSFIPPKAGAWKWPIALPFFISDPSQRPTTLRLLLATRLERVQVPFDLKNVPVADAR